MNDAAEYKVSSALETELARERTKQVGHVATIATLTALFGAGALILEPCWPVAGGVIGLGAMTTGVSLLILKSR